jgi:hypothetical protein
MVRKWSYLNNVHVDSTDNWFEGKTSVYNFKVFRMTTRFKKYNRTSITSMVRKKYARRKHRTNWLRLSYITKSWVFFFLKSKQFVRFYQSLGLFNVQAYSATTSLITKKFSEIISDRGFNTFSCSRSLLNTFTQKGQSSKYYVNPLLNSRSDGLTTRVATDLSLIENINPGLINHDGLLYPYNSDTPTPGDYLTLYNNINSNIFNKTLHYLTTTYTIMILLTLLRL